MAITVKHSKVSTIPDDADTSLVRPSDWNADHTLTGTVPIANGGTNATTAADALTNLGAYPASNPSGYGTGTVTSVAATVPSFLSVTGSPITTSGTLALTYSGTALPVANGGTGVTSSSGANSVVLRDANVNINANAFNDGYTNTAATGTQIVLTVSSVRRYTITGSGGQTIKLPDATTLVNGEIFEFDNNQSSGAITVNNNSNTLIVSVPSGGLVRVNLLSNATAAGSWDRHDYAPANVSWSTNTFDYAGSITSATWNGNAVAYNRGGTGQSSLFVAGGIVYGSTTTALAVTAIGTTGQVLTSAGAGAPIWSTPTTGTVTSVTGTAPISSSGGNTPAISISQATTSTNGYLSSTDWNTFNNKGSGTVTSVAATAGTGITITGSPITSSGTLNITNSAPMTYPSGSGIAVVSGGASWGTTLTAPSGTIVGTTDTQTLTNKRVTNRIGSNGATTSGNITPTSDTADQYNITGLTGTSAIQIPSGTPTDGQRLSIRIKDNGTARTLSWVTTAGGYRVIGTTLPLTTTANKTIYVGCVYNSADSYWDVVAVASEV